ncbi:MAG: glycosyltransferase family 4 protein [Alistipes sp.]|nr:glycosyltransferase family 4 protein [Alistipes sp.]
MSRVVLVTEHVVNCANGEFFHNELSTFVDRYHRYGSLTIFCYGKQVDNPSATKIDIQSSDMVVILDKPNTIINRFFRKGYYKRQMENAISGSDLLICHLPSYTGNVAISIARQNRIKYIVGCVGCIWDALWNYNWKGKLMAPLSFLEMRKTVKEAPYVFYVTERFLQGRYPTKGQSIACSNVCIDTGNDEVLKSKEVFLSRDTDHINLMTSAAVNVKYKGQQYVIEAISRLKRENIVCHYYLAGGGDATYLRDLAHRYNVADSVHFLGMIPRGKVLEQLEQVDIYIQPSKQEGLPRALIEAMSMGCPALGTDVAGIPELLPTEYLYQPEDVASLCEKIKDFSLQRRIEASKRNFSTAQRYDRAILDMRRNKFFVSVLESNK